jgi:hypothetical protein
VHRWPPNIAHLTPDPTARTAGAFDYADTVKSGNANNLHVWNSESGTFLTTWCLSVNDTGGYMRGSQKISFPILLLPNNFTQ